MTRNQGSGPRAELPDADVRDRLLADIPSEEHRRELGGLSTAVLEGGGPAGSATR